ncbi:MAG: hypothetical protein WDO13_04600 [Verrucomicrobiota bacterium]
MPVDAMVKKFAHTRFEPSGFTKNPDIRNAKSIPDYIFRWVGNQFIPGYREANNPNAGQQELPMREIREIEKKTLNRPVNELPVAEDSPNVARAPSRGAGDRRQRARHPLPGRPDLPGVRAAPRSSTPAPARRASTAAPAWGARDSVAARSMTVAG